LELETKVSYLDEKNIDQGIIEEAGAILRAGGLVAFPTETVYGLGANALDGTAVRKIFEAKGRPQDNPLIVHISDFDELEPLVAEVPAIARKLMDRFWPGPMTIIFKRSAVIPDETSAGLDSVGVRMPSNPIARALIKAAGVPVAAPSANISGRPSPTEVDSCIEDLSGKVDMIIGGEKCEVGVESSVIDVTEYPPCILRPGGITLEMFRTVDENIYIDPSILKKPEADFRPKAPGMKYRHYAPKAPVRIVQGEPEKVIALINEMVQNYINEGKKVGIIATDETKDRYRGGVVVSLGSRRDMDSVTRNLFETLRSFDSEGVSLILSESFEETGKGIAVMNRLKKAAGFDIIKA
jgi:L-threonylcarbamoyladenylate synthase